MGIINKSEPDISLQIGRLKLKNPILTASGTFGYSDEYEDYTSVEGLGAIVTKGITINPKAGNPQPRIKEVKNGLINSIGLENMGIYAFIERKLPILRQHGINFVLNIAGESIQEYVKLVHICQKNDIEAVELNLSCPNVTCGCLEFGKDEDTLYKLVSEVRQNFDGTILVKLSSNVSYPEKMAKTAQKAGADGISAINTVKAMAVQIKVPNRHCEQSEAIHNNTFKYVKGGLSGACIKPIALNFIYEIRKHVSIPIIGMGGISNLSDMLEFFAVGADAVQVGTANFTHPDISGKLVTELKDFLKQNGYNTLDDLIIALRQT